MNIRIVQGKLFCVFQYYNIQGRHPQFGTSLISFDWKLNRDIKLNETNLFYYTKKKMIDFMKEWKIGVTQSNL